MNMGAVIKKFRRERDITQERFAEYLNVSPQAVSRWETGAAYPEITTIPAIASFLGISTDILFGVEESKREKEIQNYLQEYKRFQASGEADKRLELSQQAKNKFPGDFRILKNYAWDLLQSLYTGLDGNSTMPPEQQREYFDEVLAVCQTILEDCTEDEIRYDIISLQIMVYKSMAGEKARASVLRAANRLPDHLLSRDAELANLYDYNTEEDIIFHQEYTQKLITSLWWEMRIITTSCQYPPEKKAAVCRRALDMYKLFYENEDYGLEEGSVAQIYQILAKIYLEYNCREEALEAVEQYVEHALKQSDALQNGFTCHSELFNRLVFEKNNYVRSYTESAEEKLIYELQEVGYQKIHDTERFQKLLAMLHNA